MSLPEVRVSHQTGKANKVVVIGAGPVGLLTALLLAQAGIGVDVLEKGTTLDESPRAAGYFGGALLALKRAKLLEKVTAQGFTCRGIVWRKPLADDGRESKRMGDVIAHLSFPQDTSKLPGMDAIVSLRQSELVKLIFADAMETGLVRVHFDTELVNIHDHGDSVTAIAKRPGGDEQSFNASFLVGADGGRSATRKILGIPLKGHTWPEKLIAIDLLTRTEGLYDINFPTTMVIDPIHFCVMTPLEKPQEGKMTLYRCAVALDAKDDRPDEVLISEKNLLSLLSRVLPGERPLQVKVVRASPYKIHQRCASTFHRGRCLLAGDAAHLNNPVGALGLTTGILDSEAAADALEMIINEGKPLKVLQIYADVLRILKYPNPVFSLLQEVRSAVPMALPLIACRTRLEVSEPLTLRASYSPSLCNNLSPLDGIPIAPPSVVGSGRISYTTTDMWLYCWRRSAAARPAGPAPMMIAWNLLR
ncbi:FAD/NAD(P)-binding domain-containing protein [Aspergillus novofumigatus IBT 16806]|uniref:FAD/NAD(P)-binding domain-containing protein n=1 Tax=Aspergillus novofumigatus (strain IBT 16806) TaxID=1392255 RepID=A0A2I1C105_ASPN1|nr:FAD/NAD(P)-binding domain-containing protein [Aspergillus novofumigatus IBT 16806]PKX91318.1 FAD/NAD(P)-binding domain-containing protein [Aspergillus novofumigatus IBT 16806]